MIVSTSSGKASFNDWPDYSSALRKVCAGKTHPHETFSDRFYDLLRAVAPSADLLENSKQGFVDLDERHVGDKSGGDEQREEVELALAAVSFPARQRALLRQQWSTHAKSHIEPLPILHPSPESSVQILNHLQPALFHTFLGFPLVSNLRVVVTSGSDHGIPEQMHKEGDEMSVLVWFLSDAAC